MQLIELTQPTAEPVTYSEAAAHLRLDGTAQQALIESYIKSARNVAEAYTRRTFMPRSFRLVLDAWETVVVLPKPPVTSINAVNVLLSNGSSVAVMPTAWRFLPGDGHAKVLFSNTSALALPGIAAGGITLDYSAGYASAADVPQAIKTAILLMVGYLYDVRVAVGGDFSPTLPMAARALLEGYRVRRVG
jgi:uncharacterized phiE125 gp8 family phage protein